MILIVDNYDSFVENLGRYLREAGEKTVIIRNDEAHKAEKYAPDASGLVISPGPKTPTDAGVSCDIIRTWSSRRPLLGVCLGHQCLAEVFGGRTRRAIRAVHGEATPISHNGSGVLKGITSPMLVGRYHSLVCDLAPDGPLNITAKNENQEIMAVEHQSRPWFGLQFHPESILTSFGRKIIDNFLTYTQRGK
ncbi:MAG: aminodeoxychorismate/anthranilate synthase component II [Pseudomonadota bacterium]